LNTFKHYSREQVFKSIRLTDGVIEFRTFY